MKKLDKSNEPNVGEVNAIHSCRRREWASKYRYDATYWEFFSESIMRLIVWKFLSTTQQYA